MGIGSSDASSGVGESSAVVCPICAEIADSGDIELDCFYRVAVALGWLPPTTEHPLENQPKPR